MEDALVAYRAWLSERELERYRHEELVWALLAPHVPRDKRSDPPEVPRVLRERG